MHESALARSLLEAALTRAGAEGARRVLRVTGTLAETEALRADALGFHFAAHARGTLADGAVLALSLVLIEARCRACGHTFAPDHHVTLCPCCGSLDAELLGEPGVKVEQLEVE